LIVNGLGAVEGATYAKLLRGDWALHIPGVCDVEVVSVLGRTWQRGELAPKDAVRLLADYLDAPLTRHPEVTLLPRMLELRPNINAADAACVALAESLGATLFTDDDRLMRAVRAHAGHVTALRSPDGDRA
jgi:predicted nucleic acid-binding protein